MLFPSRTHNSVVLHAILTLAVAILLAAKPAAAQQAPVGAKPVEPCCQITALDARTRLVTARDKATGKELRFRVTDAALLNSLHLGQNVWDMQTGKVSLDGIGPCCGITRPGATAAGNNPQGTVQPVQPCCQITANPALAGRLGRLLVAFPQGADVSSSRVDVFKAGEKASIQGGFGAQTWDLLPGTYAVSISGARVAGVTVQSGHDTRVRVGILRIKAGASTRVDLLDAGGKSTFAGGFGAQVIGLPVGTFRVQVAGQSEAVSIHEGKITEY